MAFSRDRLTLQGISRDARGAIVCCSNLCLEMCVVMCRFVALSIKERSDE